MNPEGLTLLPEPSASAVISPCATYRYSLWRWWGPGSDVLLWIMLNPSTADATVDDPTIRRCVGFATTWGFHGITVVNLFALRATDPEELRRHPHPAGPENHDHLRSALVDHSVCIAAWGAGVEKAGAKGAAAAEWVARAAFDVGRWLECLGKTKAGHPRHPLYVAASTSTQPFGLTRSGS